MAEIIFQNKLDAKRFYEHLLVCLQYHLNKPDILLIEDRHIVKINEDSLTETAFEQVKRAFLEFIIKIKRDDWLRTIIQEQFYFEDPEEQQQIIDIVYSIIEGERDELVIFLKEHHEDIHLQEAIDELFQSNVSFSFDSFLKFRLRPYLQILENYVEVSIDEYKMEQEYQIFVQMLREFLANREPKIETLHLLFDEEITFYNGELEEIKRGELIKMIDRRLLFNHPVYIDSASIAPLLSIAPTTIHLYTKSPEEPLVRTIKSIFEERVTIQTFEGLRQTKAELQVENKAKENGA